MEEKLRARIYVGGLGESVRSDDLHMIFSKMGGQIEAVDIIRTKGRSFAYVDYLPPSHNSLCKLFSTYNGCVWKGGRLRLEKAKEHYLDRLKREWTEDAQLSNNAFTTDAVDDDIDKKIESLEKPKKELSSEKKQLRIFFPRLQKLKSVPFTGTGKHKYSFRRVEVPSLPTYFCDCEEHSGRLYSADEKQIPRLEEQSGGMRKEEIDIMNSAMNKLFETENVSSSARTDFELIKEEDHSIKVADDLQIVESEGYSTADDDDLIINVASRGQEIAFSDQESKLNKRQASRDGPNQDVLKRQRRNYAENSRNEYVSASTGGKGSLQAQLIEPQLGAKQSAPGLSWSQKSSWKDLIRDKNNTATNVSEVLPGMSSRKEEQSKSDSIPKSNCKDKKLLTNENQRSQSDKTEEEGLAEAEPLPTKPDSSSNNGGRGSAWLHKASWTQLVANNNSGSFSITQILPGLTLEKQEPAKPDVVVAASRDCKDGDIVEKVISQTAVDARVGWGFGRDCNVQSSLELNQLIVMGKNDASAPSENKHSSATKQPENRRSAKHVIGETCSFMRTDASLKEWANTKAALSGSRKRKSK